MTTATKNNLASAANESEFELTVTQISSKGSTRETASDVVATLGVQ